MYVQHFRKYGRNPSLDRVNEMGSICEFWIFYNLIFVK